MAEETRTCFIIMPITTPTVFLERYRGDAGHFRNVLEHLFVPAVEAADFKPIPPIAKGADLIHAEIIKNLETADLVLCDMTILNPNVFFELGIRTALNRPVAMVRDDGGDNVPFDTGIINFHEYKVGPWSLDNEKKKLAAHLRHSYESNSGENGLWKYFGISTRAEPAKAGGTEDKVDLILKELNAMRRAIQSGR